MQVCLAGGHVLNQEEHHRKVSFREEYIAFLKEYEIDFEERFLFDDVVEK
jgi:putative transposase